MNLVNKYLKMVVFFLGIVKNNIPNGLGLIQYKDGNYDSGFY